ncbi:rhodanese-related sulfurtransferase [Tenacibaculum adriaticum]|uniref:Rhodanese-related sulfurtransferase n=1 Tax=Tenacibaculum adriaticum TaxID=413713 RepID=A0A5S5DX61_9FLAO|nr:rhodanese-like domain-containing protein [Tenacibaculum adriaticum]TYQ00315.1 rhodanese-related sulfurtransferase [Tenacibaculum adriaticum]
MKLKSLLVIAVLFFISCKQPTKEITNITVEDLKTEMSNNIQLLDVRTPEEWEQGSIKSALKINVNSDDFEKQALSKLSKKEPVYVYCKSGGRSLVASEILVSKGYKVYNVLGGYDEWKEKNKE